MPIRWRHCRTMTSLLIRCHHGHSVTPLPYNDITFIQWRHGHTLSIRWLHGYSMTSLPRNDASVSTMTPLLENIFTNTITNMLLCVRQADWQRRPSLPLSLPTSPHQPLLYNSIIQVSTNCARYVWQLTPGSWRAWVYRFAYCACRDKMHVVCKTASIVNHNYSIQFKSKCWLVRPQLMT